MPANESHYYFAERPIELIQLSKEIQALALRGFDGVSIGTRFLDDNDQIVAGPRRITVRFKAPISIADLDRVGVVVDAHVPLPPVETVRQKRIKDLDALLELPTWTAEEQESALRIQLAETLRRR